MIGFLLIIIVPLFIMFCSFPLFSYFFKQIGIKPSPWHGFIPLIATIAYFCLFIVGILPTIIPLFLALIIYILVSKK